MGVKHERGYAPQGHGPLDAQRERLLWMMKQSYPCSTTQVVQSLMTVLWHVQG